MPELPKKYMPSGLLVQNCLKPIHVHLLWKFMYF